MVNVYSIKGEVVGKVELPDVFKTDYRPDIIQRAVVALQSLERQVYGVSEDAGLKSSADYFGRRKGAYRTTVNKGMSRLPREKTGGGGLGRVRLIPSSVGGHRAHPPKMKDWTKDMNNKEYLLALKSAIAATTVKELVEERGHITEKIPQIPIIVEDDFEKLAKTKDVYETLEALGMGADLLRAEEKTVRAGKGKTRGRKYKKKKSALIVVSDDAKIGKSARNIPGIDIATVGELDVELLAPGTHAGRLTIWTKTAVESLKDIDKIIGI